MSCQPPSPESVAELRQLRDRAFERGDECLAALLSGVDLYVAIGRELEILDVMRQLARDVHYAVENTPTAEDLRRLYEMPDHPENQGS
jgi:hypothetical protein